MHMIKLYGKPLKVKLGTFLLLINLFIFKGVPNKTIRNDWGNEGFKKGQPHHAEGQGRKHYDSKPKGKNHNRGFNRKEQFETAEQGEFQQPAFNKEHH